MCLLSVKACKPCLLAPSCPLVDVLLSIHANLKDAWKHVGSHVYITWAIYFLHKWTQPGNPTLFYNWSLKHAWVIHLQWIKDLFLFLFFYNCPQKTCLSRKDVIKKLSLSDPDVKVPTWPLDLLRTSQTCWAVVKHLSHMWAQWAVPWCCLE